MDNRQVLDTFGEVVVQGFKQSPLEWFDNKCSGDVSSDSDLAMHAMLKKMSPREIDFIRDLINDALTLGIHDFLFRFGELRDNAEDTAIRVEGRDLYEISDGLNGEVFGDAGWERFSSYPDRFALMDKYEQVYREQRDKS